MEINAILNPDEAEIAHQNEEDKDDPTSLSNLNNYKWEDEDQKGDLYPTRERPWEGVYGSRPRVTLTKQHHSGRISYTSLATDNYECWLCPVCIIYKPATDDNPEESLRWNYAEQIGYTIVDSPETRALLQEQCPSGMYPAIDQDRGVGYFANPPAALHCLHNWKARDGSGETENCTGDRSKYHPSLPHWLDSKKKTTWFQDRCDPDNIRGFDSLQQRVSSVSLYNKHPQLRLKSQEGTPDYDEYSQYADPRTYSRNEYRATWPCPKCSVLVDERNRVKEWHLYADSTIVDPKAYSRRFMPVTFQVLNEKIERLCYVNAFGEQDRQSRGYICANKRFGDGPGGDPNEACGYQYGTEFRFETKEGPHHFVAYSPA